MSDFLGEYNKKVDKELQREHEEAGKDFDKGDVKDGKDMDDKIGYQHDRLADLERRVALVEKEVFAKKEKEALKEGAKEQQDMNKKDEKEGGDK